MPKRAASFELAALTLDPHAAQPLHRQLYVALRMAVLHQKLAPGMRLPSTRDLHMALGVSRNTVVTAFEQLIAEGYLESRTGDGTYVTRAIPDGLLNMPGQAESQARQTAHPVPVFSQRFHAMSAAPSNGYSDEAVMRPFRTGSPGLDETSARAWARLLARCWRNTPSRLLDYGATMGYTPLRQAIADYLGAARGVRCSAEQIIVTSGSQDALNLVALLLLNAGDAVWMEEPGYRGARAALLMAGAQIVPVPVDGEGVQVELGIARCPEARMVYVTPSHQYPMGVTMSLTRRLALIDWARRARVWIIEDDYDSELRYQGRPLSSLQGLDDGQQVLYIGTFSKVLFPSLRLGYLVVPELLVDGFQTILRSMQHHLPGVEQAVLTDFILEGYFARHIRHMRLLYAERQQLLLQAVQRELGNRLQIGPCDGGLHVAGLLPAGIDDMALSAAAYKHGIEALALSSHCVGPLQQGGLVLGYAGFSAEQIIAGVRGLRAAFDA